MAQGIDLVFKHTFRHAPFCSPHTLLRHASLATLSHRIPQHIPTGSPSVKEYGHHIYIHTSSAPGSSHLIPFEQSGGEMETNWDQLVYVCRRLSSLMRHVLEWRFICGEGITGALEHPDDSCYFMQQNSRSGLKNNWQELPFLSP